MLWFIFGGGVVLLVGYLVARHHHRLREFGVGTAAGTAVGPVGIPGALPSVSDVQGRDGELHPGTGGGEWSGDVGGADSSAGDSGSDP